MRTPGGAGSSARGRRAKGVMVIWPRKAATRHTTAAMMTPQINNQKNDGTPALTPATGLSLLRKKSYEEQTCRSSILAIVPPIGPVQTCSRPKDLPVSREKSVGILGWEGTMGLGRITVFGSSRVTPDEATYRNAMRLGRLLAQGGYTVCSGGYAGVMEAVSRGAAEAGGTVIGITVRAWAPRLQANPWVAREVAAPHLFQRLMRLTESDAYIALNGGPVTLLH